MPPSTASGSLPPDVAVRVRAYLAAFLPPQAVDEAVDEVTADSRFWGDTDVIEILAVAHTVLASRLRVAPEVEVLVLQEDVGLPVADIATVLGLPQPQVRRMLDEALAVLADPDLEDATPGGTAPAPDDASPPSAADPPRAPEESPSTPLDAATDPGASARVAAEPTTPPAQPVRVRRRRRRVLVVVATLAVVGIALAAAWFLSGVDDCPDGADVCIEEVVLTDAVDPATGTPDAARDSFTVGEPITLWFSFSRRTPAPGPVEVRWYRDGVLLYGTEVQLGEGDRLNVSLAALWSGEPGRYRAEVADGDHVLVVRDFRVTQS